MLGADARQFNKGWFDASRGYQFLGEEQASYFTKAGMAIFRFLQECPLWTVGVGSEVTRFRPGDEVYGDNLWLKGGFADYACAPEKALDHYRRVRDEIRDFVASLPDWLVRHAEDGT